MARRIGWILGVALSLGLLAGAARADGPGDAVVFYSARLRCADLVTGEHLPQCMVVSQYQGSGWVQGYVEGDRLILHGAYAGLSAPVAADLALGVHLHHDPNDYHVDTLVRGLASEGGTSGLFHGSVPLTPAYRTLLETGRMYVDIHTSAAGPGELKGVLVPLSPAGEPAW